MESFYPGRALRTHFVYYEPHNIETHFHNAPWERRYRRWIYTPPTRRFIGTSIRSWAAAYVMGCSLGIRFLRKMPPHKLVLRIPKFGMKIANKMFAVKVALGFWQVNSLGILNG